MAKKRHKPKPGTLIPVLSMKGSPEWREWLEDLANSQGISTSRLVELSTAAYARTLRFRAPPIRTPLASHEHRDRPTGNEGNR